MDAASRGDICWASFAVIPSVMLAVLNVINMPYILSGGKRAIIAEEIPLNELAIKRIEEMGNQYRGEDTGRGEESALMRPSLDIGRELDTLATYERSSDSDSDGIDGGIVQIEVSDVGGSGG